MKQLGLYMNKTFSGRINAEKLKRLRDRWKGKIIMKGVATSEDAIMCVESDLDGIIVSNHGGRQLDAGQSSIGSLPGILESVRSKLTIMIDSGFQSGPDIARGLASGADFIFLGRTFMYGVAALGKRGGDHTISILKAQLQQVMEQLGCSDIKNLPSYLVQTRN
jgi:L-lactate dehydrogenase (cytochrome)